MTFFGMLYLIKLSSNSDCVSPGISYLATPILRINFAFVFIFTIATDVNIFGCKESMVLVDFLI